jgi:hypothetical protein
MTLDDFRTAYELQHRTFKLTFKGKMRLLFGELKAAKSRDRTADDINFIPDLVDCRFICGPEDIDLCRNRGRHVCRWRHL